MRAFSDSFHDVHESFLFLNQVDNIFSSKVLSNNYKSYLKNLTALNL